MTQETKADIEKVLQTLSFVSWDRFIDTGEGTYIIYGWIDREKDAYKDFVQVTYDEDWGWQSFSTSSAKHSLEIHRLMFGEEAEGHNDCQRVEGNFDVTNCIHI